MIRNIVYVREERFQPLRDIMRETGVLPGIATGILVRKV